MRSDLPGLVHLAGHVGAISFVGLMIGFGVPGWWLLLPVQGLLIIALFMLAHECTHQTPFKSRALNEAVGHVAAFAIIIPFRWFRYFHLAHHKWTNIPGKDPELDSAKPNSRASWMWHVSGLPLWRQLIGLWWRLAVGHESATWLPDRARPAVLRDARICLVIYAILLAGALPVLLWVWIIPLILGQPVLRLYLLAEHGDCPQVANMFDNTRTTFTNQLVRWLAWNMPFHTEHHVWPDVPFHKLPALHAVIANQLNETADGYVAFNKAYLSRRLQPRAGADTAGPAQ